MAEVDLEGEGLRDPQQDLGRDPAAIAARWIIELQTARKGPYKRWMERAKKAIRRFRDENVDDGEAGDSRRNARFNVLWSNIQTVGPSIYSRAPKPVAERRYLDRDVIARAAAVILQRSLSYTIEDSELHETLKQCRTDYQLVGFASAWLRYDVEVEAGQAEVMDLSTMRRRPTEAEDEAIEQEGEGGDDEGEGERKPPKIKSQRIIADYTHWSDDLVSACRYWQERTWRAKRAYYRHAQAVKKFGREVADQLPYSTTRGKRASEDMTDRVRQAVGTVEVWQIWDMVDRQVIYICEGYGAGPLKVENRDVLGLPGFVPAARPLRATTTNDSFWPIPDYAIWHDQAAELDNLTARITALTRAIKAVGVYDASQPDLARLLQEGMENKLVGVQNWAKLTQRGGLEGSVSMLPIKEMAEVLVGLYQARQQVKADLYEISGVSDVLRGATDPNETATAQRLKGQFGSLRGNDRRNDFNTFVRDTLVLMAEIMLEHYTADTLWEMSDFAQWWADQSPEAYREDKPEQPGMGHNGGPPLDDMPPASPPMPPPQQPGGPPMPGAGAPMQMMPPPPPPPPTAREVFEDALDLLRNDRLRSFRISVETNSTIDQDAMAEQSSRTEFLTATAGFLANAGEMAASYPQLMPVLGKMLLFGARGFSVGRELESSLETLVADLEAQARNPKPKPPSPDEIKAKSAQEKAQVDMAKVQMQGQQQQQQHQLEMQRMAAEMQAEQQKMALELQAERQRLELEREKLMLQIQGQQQLQQLKMQGAQMDMAVKAQQGEQQLQLDAQRGEIEAQKMGRQAEHDERKADLQGEQMERQAQMAERQAQIKGKQMEAGANGKG